MNELLSQGEKFGKVPESIYTLIKSGKVADLAIAAGNSGISIRLQNRIFVLSLDRLNMEAHVWHRVNISIENTGTASRTGCEFHFSREFETRWIRPKSINAGKTEMFENIAIHPNIKGEVPLEISLTFHDARNNEYTEKQEFFINVRLKAGSPHSPIYSAGYSFKDPFSKGVTSRTCSHVHEILSI